jgi:predicted nucleic-acid-binding protein
VRCVTLDDPQQANAARLLLSHPQGVFISKTVLLELEWVLRAAYKLPRSVIAQTLYKLLGLPNVVAENQAQLAQALFDFAQGLDFADAVHAASSPSECALHTFDAQFAQVAQGLGRAVVLAQITTT